MVNKDLGMVTAYAYAVSKGYTGTEEEFAELMADYAEVGERAEAAATAAAASATAASDSASDSAASASAAAGSAGTATTAAGNASQAAQNASQSATAAAGSATAAGQSATAAAGSATTAGDKATEAAQSATAAAGSATTAGASATAAQTAQTAAETAQEAAETAQEAAEDAQAAAEAAAQTLVIDPTLTQQGQAADAKAVGDANSLLKSHIDQETDTEKINLIKGFVTCNETPVNLTPTVNNLWQCAVVPCSEGDVFTLTGQGGNGPRLWCFVDSQRNIIENANSSISLSDVAISAPSEATHFIFNDNTLSGYLYHGKTDVADKTETDANKKSLFEYNSVNLLDYSKLKTQTINGVTFEPTENGILVSGQATATVLYRMCGLQVDMGIKFVPGKAYAIKYKSTKVRFQIRDDSNIYLDTTTDAIYIPSVVESQCALVVSSGVAVNEVVQPFIFNSLSNAELEELATENIVPYMRHDNVSENGITWTWVNNNSQITVSGTTTDGSILPLIKQTDVPPDDFTANHEYFIDFLDDDVHITVRAYDSNGNQILYTDFNTPSFLGLPHETVNVALSLVVSSGTTVNKTVDAPKIYQKMRLEDLSKIVGQISHKVGYADQISTDDECINVFVAELNAMAASWGMSDTIIASPSGLDTESFMSVADMLKAAIACLSSPDLLDIASTSDFTMPIYGQHARTITVRNSYLSAIKNKFVLHDDYALGGKGGSLIYTETDRTRTQLTYADIGGHLTALCLMGKGQTAYANIYNTCDDVSLAVKAVYAGEEPVITENMTEIVESGGGYVAVECSESGILYAKQMPAAKIIEKFKSVSGGIASINRPCSVIKMMSTMLALRYIVDKSAFISLHLTDITGGSGSPYYVGDRVNVIDMLKAMLVESSNTLAVAMARHIGASILSGRR